MAEICRFSEEKQSSEGELVEAVPLRTPLPKTQIAILLLVQMPEQLTASVIYPFVNQLVRSTGITGGNERKTGYYAGLIVCCFSVDTGPPLTKVCY
jgi:hypothetical protein